MTCWILSPLNLEADCLKLKLVPYADKLTILFGNSDGWSSGFSCWDDKELCCNVPGRHHWGAWFQHNVWAL